MSVFGRIAKRLGYVPEAEQRVVRVPVMRKFEAAGSGAMVQELPRSPNTIDQELRQNYRVLVARARWLAQNDDYVRRLLKLVKNNIIGPRGIVLQGRMARGAGELDELANSALESAWKAWGRPGVCVADRRLSWRDVERLAVESVTRDGEFCAIQNQNSKRNAFGYDLTIIDSLRLDSTFNGEVEGGNVVRMGVEMGPLSGPLGQVIQQPVAYWLLRDRLDRGEGWLSMTTARTEKHVRVSADSFIHMYLTEYAEQSRGFTPLVSGIARINMLGGYEDSVATAARVGAAQSFFVEESESGEGFSGDVETSERQVEEEWEIEPGVGRSIPHGAKLHPYTPSQPTTQYGDFVKATLRGAAAGWGVSYHSLANDLEGVNYSSARVGELTDRDEWQAGQEFVTDSLHSRAFESWLMSALANGQIKIKGNPVGIARMERFKQVEWQPRRWNWVDPLKMEQANDLRVNGRRASISQIIRESGRDPDDVFREWDQDKRRLEALGIGLPTGKGNEQAPAKD